MYQLTLLSNMYDKNKKDLEQCSKIIEARHRYSCGLEGVWTDSENRSRNFFLSPDGQNSELYYELKKLGYRNAGFNAEYNWKVYKDGVLISYTEGDVYLSEYKTK